MTHDEAAQLRPGVLVVAYVPGDNDWIPLDDQWVRGPVQKVTEPSYHSGTRHVVVLVQETNDEHYNPTGSHQVYHSAWVTKVHPCARR